MCKIVMYIAYTVIFEGVNEIMKKILSVSLFLLLGLIFLRSNMAFAQRAPQELQNVIANITIFDKANGRNLTPTSGVYNMTKDSNYAFYFMFDLTAYDNNLVDGDFFEIEIPAPIALNNAETISVSYRFPNATEVQLADVFVTANPGINAGGKLKFTLKNLAQYMAANNATSVENVTGNFFVTINTANTQNASDIAINTGNNVFPFRYQINPRQQSGDNAAAKANENYVKLYGVLQNDPVMITSPSLGYPTPTPLHVHHWGIRINTSKETYQTIVIRDEVSQNHAPMMIIPETFTLYRGSEFNSGWILDPATRETLVQGTDYTVDITSDFQKFTLTIHTVPGKEDYAYLLRYMTTAPGDGSKVANSVWMEGDGNQVIPTKSVPGRRFLTVERNSLVSSGGSITIDPSNALIVYKVDQDTRTRLAGATFEITQPDGTIVTATTDAQGRLVYKFSNNFVGRQFTAREIVPPNGYAFENKAFTFTLGRDGVFRTVTNKKRDPAAFSIHAKKTLSGRALAANEFTFVLEAEDGTKTEVTNLADGSISFPPLSTIGTKKYKLYEKQTAVAGVTLDPTIYSVEVSVAIDANDQLQATVKYFKNGVEVPMAVFDNTYQTAVTGVHLQARKTLSGGILAANQFRFELVDQNGNVVDTVGNTAAGDIQFATLNFNIVGSYAYTIQEVPGSTGGYIYSAERFPVRVVVSDNGLGALLATVTYPNGNIPTFINTYSPGATNIIIRSTTEIQGRTINFGQFQYELVEVNGGVETLVGTTHNDANGDIVFPPVPYTTAGARTYRIRQIQGNAGDILYDTNTHLIEVNVSDDGTGNLAASFVTVGRPHFINRLRPTAYGSRVPQTGDTSNIALWIVTFLGSALMLNAALKRRRS